MQLLAIVAILYVKILRKALNQAGDGIILRENGAVQRTVMEKTYSVSVLREHGRRAILTSLLLTELGYHSLLLHYNGLFVLSSSSCSMSETLTTCRCYSNLFGSFALHCDQSSSSRLQFCSRGSCLDRLVRVPLRSPL